MSRHLLNVWVVAVTAAVFAVPARPAAQTPAGEVTARAELVGVNGERIGEVRLRETPFHGVILDVDVRGLTPGVHAIHIHQTGRCEAPSFSSAGGHYAPRGRAHGALHPEGKHAGDLLNLHVPESGRVRIERLAADVTLLDGPPHSLFDADGSAIVIHAAADDYRSQPSGAAGDRVACGVVVR